MSTITAPRPHALDPGRITAGAGAIALNAVALMLMLVPIAAPPMVEALDDEPIVILDRPSPPPPPPPPIRVDVTRPTPRTVVEPRPIERPVVQPPTDTTEDPQPGDIVVPPGDERVFDVVTEPVLPSDPGRPLQGAHLEYASAPPPPYPREALIGNLTGTVMLQVLVDVDGKPLEVTVQRSSGHRLLDVAARRQVLAKWRFNPAMRNGVPVQAIGVIPVEFKLD